MLNSTLVGAHAHTHTHTYMKRGAYHYERKSIHDMLFPTICKQVDVIYFLIKLTCRSNIRIVSRQVILSTIVRTKDLNKSNQRSSFKPYFAPL